MRAATGKPATYYVVTARISKVTAASGEAACRRVERANPRHGALCGRSVALRTAQHAELVLGLTGGVPGRCYTVVTRRRRAKQAAR
jgi:hypothetical protein